MTHMVVWVLLAFIVGSCSPSARDACQAKGGKYALTAGKTIWSCVQEVK